MRHQFGQSVTEYSIIVGLIALAAIPAVALFNGSLKQGMFGFSKSYEPPTSIQLTAPETGIPDSATLPIDDPVKPLSSAGNSANSSDYTLSLTGVVTTVGVNGATAQLAGQLKTLADTLLANEEISQEEHDKLTALANQGLRMADLEKRVEDANASYGSNGDFLNASVIFDGKSYTMPEVATLIGFGTPGDLTQDMQRDPEYMLKMESTPCPETATFLNLYYDALSGENLQKSDAGKIVTQLSSEIAYLSDAITNMIYGAYASNVTLADLKGNNISSATVYDSHAICHVGPGQCSG